jgi:hypothetical protein
MRTAKNTTAKNTTTNNTLLVITAAIGLTLASTGAFAGGGTRDHRGSGGSPQGGGSVWSGPHPFGGGGRPREKTTVQPAPSGTTGGTVHDHRKH